jgi:hypothetical protein
MVRLPGANLIYSQFKHSVIHEYSGDHWRVQRPI